MRSITTRISILFSVCALALFAHVPKALAADDPRGWMGGMFGLAVPNYQNSTARPIWGLTAGAKIGSEIGLGAYYLTSSKDEDASSGIKSNFQFDLYGVELGYHFEGEARGAYFGGRLGTSQVKVTALGTSLQTSPMHYGFMAGYNFFMNDHFSLGGEVNYMSVASSSTSGVTIDSFSTLNFLGSAKAWF